MKNSDLKKCMRENLVCASTSPRPNIVLSEKQVASSGHEPADNGNIDEDTDNDDEDLDLSSEFVENQCHICKLQLPNRDDLFNHVEADHLEYHQEMFEIIAKRRNTIEPN